MKIKKKQCFYIGGFVLLVSLLALAVAFVFVYEAPPPLTCDAPVFAFGRMPVKNAQGSGKHVFVIKNNTSKDIRIEDVVASCPCTTLKMDNKTIGAHGSVEIVAEIALPANQSINRVVDILVVPEDKAIRQLLLRVTGKVEFSPFLVPSRIDFGDVFSNSKKKNEIRIMRPDNRDMGNFIKTISWDENTMLQAGGVKYERNRIRDIVDDEQFFVNVAVIPVVLDGNKFSTLGDGTQTLRVELTTNETLEIPVHWKLSKKPVFEPSEREIIFAGIKAGEAQSVTIIYNEDAGGKYKTTRIAGEGLSLAKTERDGDAVFIQLRYTSKENVASGEVGSLVVETQDGKTHKLPIVADVAEK